MKKFIVALFLAALTLAPVAAQNGLPGGPGSQIPNNGGGGGGGGGVTYPIQLGTAASGQSGQGIVIGVGAAPSYFAGPNSYWLTALGTYAAHAASGQGMEVAAVGAIACRSITIADQVVCIGQNAGGEETSAGQWSAVGNDAMRDTIGEGFSSAFGQAALRDGIGSLNTALGYKALQGNGGSITLGGTVTVGDVVKITLTSTNPGTSGVPVTVQYTTVGGDTLQTIASALALSITNLNISSTDVDGNNLQTLLLLHVNAFTTTQTGPVIGLEFPGSQTTGWKIVPAFSCTGTCTETATVADARSGARNIAIGPQALLGTGMTTAADVISIGSQSGFSLTTGLNDVFMGTSAANAATTEQKTVAIGYRSGLLMAGTNGNTLLGCQAGSSITTGSHNTVLGAMCDSSDAIAAGSGNIVVGYGAQVLFANASNQMTIGNLIYATGVTSNTSKSTGPVSISGSLNIGSATALTQSLGEFGLAKITATGTAPGATGGKIALVCGTAAGSGKLIVYGGTSTTPATILDNIGSGITGC